MSTSPIHHVLADHATSTSGDANETQESLNRPHEPNQPDQQQGLPDFKTVTDQLDGIAPRFEVNAGQIEILREPKDFYEALKVSLFV